MDLCGFESSGRREPTDVSREGERRGRERIDVLHHNLVRLTLFCAFCFLVVPPSPVALCCGGLSTTLVDMEVVLCPPWRHPFPLETK